MDGEVYKTKSEQWAWRVFDDGGDLAAGAGYDDEAEAEADMCEQLGSYRERELRTPKP